MKKKDNDTFISEKLQRWILLAVIVLSFGLSLKNGYSLDDENVTTESNLNVAKGFAGIKDILLSPYSYSDDGRDAFEYRPVTAITFAIEKALFGFSPAISHLINLLLYIAVVLLALHLLNMLLAGYPAWIPFAVAFIFALHPLHAEVVNSLKNREELLVALFGFSVLYWMLRFCNERKWYYLLIVTLLLFVGINTKPSLTPFLAFVPFTLACFGKTSWFRAAGMTVAFVAWCTVAINLPRLLIDVDLTRGTVYFENPLFDMPVMERLPMAFYSFLIYLKLHLIPYPLLSYYGYAHVKLVSWSSWEVYVGFTLFMAFVGAALYFLKRDKLLFYGLVSFLLFIFPYLNFPIPVPGIVAERLAFNSVFGFSVILVALLRRLIGSAWFTGSYNRNLNFVVMLAAAVGVIFSVINMQRTRNWESFLTLMQADEAKAPKSVKLQVMYGDRLQVELSKTTDAATRTAYLKEAIEAYKRAIEVYPGYGGTQGNLGVVYTMSGNYKEAIPHLQQAIALGEDRAANFYNLGACYEMSGDKANALKNYRESVRKDPQYRPALERIRFIESGSN